MKKILIAAALIVSAGIFLILSQQPQESYTVSSAGLVSYTVLSPSYTASQLPDNSTKIVFNSRGWKVYALLGLPNSSGPYPAVVVLPGGNVGKEMEHNNLAKDLRSLGFATLTLDQRGIGETGGPFPPLEKQFVAFENRNEPAYHAMVADAMTAAALLSTLPNIDRKRIYLAGVSMGGRVALIAGSLSPVAQGVLAVSSAGFELPLLPDEQKKFMNSINPDAYVALLSPRPVVLMHTKDDTVIPFSLAQKTFSIAKEPKLFLAAATGGHGYYTSHFALLRKAAAYLESKEHLNITGQ